VSVAGQYPPAVTSPRTAGDYWPQALNADCPTWGNYEVNHSAPADDPHNYTNLNNVALCYPFNCVWTVAAGEGDKRYRNASGDLPFVRHYSLNENDFRNASNSDICGYYTCDWDHAGRAVMLAELYAMSHMLDHKVFSGQEDDLAIFVFLYDVRCRPSAARSPRADTGRPRSPSAATSRTRAPTGP